MGPLTTLKSRTGRRVTNTNQYEMKQINRRDITNNDSTNNYIFYDIRPDDSLASLALRFRCSVAKIKELNRIGNDLEFYALNRIKLPNGSFGILGELLSKEKQDQNSNLKSITSSQYPTPGSALRQQNFYQTRLHRSNPTINDLLTSSNVFDSSQDQNQLSASSTQLNTQFGGEFQLVLPTLAGQELPSQVEDILIPDLSGQTRVEAIFNSLDQHIEQVKASTESFQNRSSELVNDVILSGNGQEQFVIPNNDNQKKRKSIYACNDGDFGLNYRNLLIFIFLVCLIVPLMYVLYIEETTTQ